MHQDKVITIDGPSGVGKGTLARWLSRKLGYALLDSGSIYRLAALHVIQENIDDANENIVVEACKQMEIAFEIDEASQVLVFLNGENVTRSIRNEETGMVASRISAYPKVRALLLDKQREFSTQKGLVADGRDMGTVVFPKAKYKFFLDANPQVRAERRYQELCRKGGDVDFDEVYQQLAERDHKDRTRKIAPLAPADNAIIIDTSALTVDDVQQTVLKVIL